MNTWTRNALTFLLTCLALACGAVALAHYILQQRYDAALRILEPRIARLQGLVSVQGDVEQALNGALEALRPSLHAGGAKAQNEIQQKLRQLIDSAGATVVASQSAYEQPSDQRMGRVRLTATVTGEWTNVLRLLETIQSQTPPFEMQTTTVMRENGNSTVEPQVVRLTLQLVAPLATESMK